MKNTIYQSEQLICDRYRCEYLVIGSGAGGSVAAMELAEAGKDIIVIEEGFHYKTADFTNNISNMTQNTWRNMGIAPFWGKPPIGFAEGKCVGGGTVINGGLLWRTPQRILDIWANEYGVSGYTNDDLKLHFEKIEKILNVSYHKIDDKNIDSDIENYTNELYNNIDDPIVKDFCFNGFIELKKHLSNQSFNVGDLDSIKSDIKNQVKTM